MHELGKAKNKQGIRLISLKIIILAVIFGAAGWLVLKIGLTIPIIGTEVNIDPHELFVTLGAAFTGPVGGVAVALIADSGRPASPAKWILILAHVCGGLWMGFSYRTLVYKKMRMPLLLAGWVVLIGAYYFIFVIPFLMMLMVYGVLPPEFIQMAGGTDFWKIYAAGVRIGFPEVIVTTLITTVVIAVLPPKYRRPLWRWGEADHITE